MPRNLDLKQRASATKRTVAAAVAVPSKPEPRQSRERTAEKKSSRVGSASKMKSKRSSKGSEESKKMLHQRSKSRQGAKSGKSDQVIVI